MSETTKPLRVGIVGADTKASWAQHSHIPAIHALPEFVLAAVATREAQSAKDAATAFGADHWFDDPLAMIRSDLVDVVTVAVRVPAHRDLVMAAIAAGKAVYCESPLGRSVSEAEEMATAARATDTHAVIGLQGRWNPSLRRAAGMIRSGAIGRPLTARVVSTSAGFGPAVPSAYDYFNKAESGADLSTITAAHTLDALEALVGTIHEVDARASILFPEVELIDTGATSRRETPDQVSILGVAGEGCEFVMDVNGGVPEGHARFDVEIRGGDGWLKLKGGFPFGFQAADLELTSSARFDRPDAPAVGPDAPPTAINVGEVYAMLAEDIRTGRRATPGFDHAVRTSRLIETVLEAARSGSRRTIPH